jgi:hypothetical protein
LLLLLVNIFASLEQVFLLQSLCGFAPSVAGDFAGFFFCFDAILVQKICSNVSGEVSGKITLPEKLLRCFNSIKKLVRRLRRDPLYFASNRFCYNQAKAGLFCFTKAILGF